MVFEGQVVKVGRNIDTDVIIPARYLVTFNPDELAKHCFEGLGSNFQAKLKPGTILVAEENFGCGSSREHAPIAIKGCGVSCIIASSFARIFYRNAINIGLPIVECPEFVKEAQEGDTVVVSLDKGKITNLKNNKSYQAKPFPPFLVEIIKAGGLVNWAKERLKREAK